MKITRKIFEEQWRPRFGSANPERMNLEFWKWMIRGDNDPPAENAPVMERFEWNQREGLLKSSYSPYQVRELFHQSPNVHDGPIWTFERMGSTQTSHPDGRMICVAGEHEDYYDRDFCIYNDVVNLNIDGSIEIYGYPKEVFPPGRLRDIG